MQSKFPLFAANETDDKDETMNRSEIAMDDETLTSDFNRFAELYKNSTIID